MIIEAFLIGIIIGYIRRGSLSKFKYMEFKLSFLILLAVLCHLAITVMNLGLIEFKTNYYVIALTAAYILTILVLTINLNYRYVIIIWLGSILNLISFLANGFKFAINPTHVNTVFGTEMYDLLMSGKIKFFIPLEEAKLWFLGNIIYINKPFLGSVILSIGDIIIAIGIIFFVQSIMKDKSLISRRKLEFKKGIL